MKIWLLIFSWFCRVILSTHVSCFFNSCTRSKVIGEIGSFSNLHGKKLHVSQDYSVLTCVKTAYLTLIWSFAALRDLEKLM